MEKPQRQTLDQPLLPCRILIDKEGQWFYEGARMDRREIVLLFYNHLSMDTEGRYILEMAGERCLLEVEDTAFVVKKMGGDDGLVLFLSDDSTEELAPETLYVGKKNVLYCRVKGGLFPARFTRAAYYQLTAHVEEQDGSFFLRTGNRSYRIQESEPGSPQ